jgi:4-hydroxy-tetrahydrodipicolinate reductase
MKAKGQQSQKAKGEGATKIAITGAAGRMGKRLVALARQQANQFEIVGAIGRPESGVLSEDAGEVAGIGPIGLPLTFDLKPTPQVLIDFTSPAAMRHWLKTCRDRGIAMVIGTTGLQSSDHATIDQAATDIAILQSPNMSLGINVLFKLVADVARKLGDDYDIEILEAHHRLKKDAPSGTASELANSILKATGKKKDQIVYGRHGEEAERQRGQIGMHSIRMGDEVGRHAVYFGGAGERLELSHVATSRDTFAQGALRAAVWLAQQKPGRYTMADMLGNG